MRKRKYILAALLIVVLNKSATAQEQEPTPAKNKTVSQVLDFWISETERLVVPAAEAMPESSYSLLRPRVSSRVSAPLPSK